MTILTADDNKKIRELIKVILKNSDHSFLEADSGRAAINSFSKNNPDIILMDIKMNDIDGIEATRIIRQKSSAVKIIMITDYDDKSLRQNAKDAGADHYLLKENLLQLKQMLKN